MKVESIRRGLVVLTTIGVALLAVATIAGYLGRTWWLLDLFVHFRFQYAILLFTLAGLAFFYRRKRTGFAALALCLANLASFGNCYFGSRVDPIPDDRLLSLVSANVQSANSDFVRIVDYIQLKSPQVAVILEVSPRWESELIKRLPQYSHRHIVSQDNNFGIAIFSTLPLESVETLELRPGGPPSIMAELSIGGRQVVVIATHPVPPVSSRARTKRNQQLEALEKIVVEKRNTDLIVVGDLNDTPWSSSMRRFAAAGLEDTRVGFGFQPTWPVYFWPSRIPIDHCFVAPSLIASQREVGPDIGSDHFPVFVEISIRR